MKKKWKLIPIFAFGAVILYVLGSLIWQYLAGELMDSRIQRSQTKLLNILRKEPRYDNVIVNPVAYKGGMLWCGGYVDNTNDLKSLTVLLEDFAAHNIPIRNVVVLSSELRD